MNDFEVLNDTEREIEFRSKWTKCKKSVATIEVTDDVIQALILKKYV